MEGLLSTGPTPSSFKVDTSLLGGEAWQPTPSSFKVDTSLLGGEAWQPHQEE